MKKTIMIISVVLVLIAMGLAELQAQTLPVDTRKKEMQFHKSWEALKYAAPADTSWHKITIPANTMEVLILPVTGAIGVRQDSTYTNFKYFEIAAGVPIKLPAYKATKFYVRRTAAATASVANILFLKM
jgi:hypothetical protein